ncbi:hypothetical protein HYDPIDRAFT_114619 [Hydnomerulius pinastri MD-312]|uniref:Uncharacterized protein n=1 Tax=Hydnomerulius pinastri MD-312 TaxID=994086 RepID=A0A0C9W6E8_9AGAM|nr:hypothetical protein HYDPIDRAFT_114619 [Hydnomerulius pinastri MD-312]
MVRHWAEGSAAASARFGARSLSMSTPWLRAWIRGYSLRSPTIFVSCTYDPPSGDSRDVQVNLVIMEDPFGDRVCTPDGRTSESIPNKSQAYREHSGQEFLS